MEKQNWKVTVRNNLVLIAIAVLVIITAITNRSFLTTQNFTNIMYQFVALGFVALGMTFIVLGRYIDLSVAGLFSLTSMISAIVMLNLLESMGPAGAALIGILAGLALGTVCGMITGGILVVSGANTQAKALFITYGMSSIYIAVALLIGQGMTFHIYDYFPICTFLGAGKIGFVAWSFILYLIVLFALYVFEKKTYSGRSIKYMGGNADAARLCGMPIYKLRIMIYGLCGLTTAIGAIINLCRVTTANSASGRNMETNAILAVVVGGTHLTGGKGTVLRTVIGVLVVTLMANCLNIMGISSYTQNIVKGGILVLAIWLDYRNQE